MASGRRSLPSNGSSNGSSFSLKSETEVRVRFNEVDSLGIAWHGHYVKYFEDGREGFGEQYGLSYLEFYRNGLITPIVSLVCNFKRPLQYGDVAIVETTFIDTPAAKINFQYRIFNAQTRDLVCEGSTVQVFLSAPTRELLLVTPDTFLDWKAAAMARQEQ